MKNLLIGILMLAVAQMNGQTDHLMDKSSLSFQRGSVFGTNAFLKGSNLEKEPIRDIWSGSLNIGKQTTGKKYWQQNYLYPFVGAGVFIASFGEVSKELGTPVALYGFFAAPFVRKIRSSIDYEIRLGLAFNWKPFNPINNPNNISIGAGETVYMDIGASYAYQFNQEISGVVGASISHFSNGALRKPNLGINAIAPKLSIIYQSGSSQKNFIFLDTVPQRKKNEWNFSLFMGITNIVFDSLQLDVVEKYEGTNFPTFGVSTSINKRMGQKSKVGLGFSVDYHTYYQAVVSVINNDVEKVNHDFSNRFAVSIFPSYELVIDHLSVILQPGFYLYRSRLNDNNPRLYQRLGIKYHLNNDLFLGANLRAFNYHVSDFIEWNIGYRLDWE